MVVLTLALSGLGAPLATPAHAIDGEDRVGLPSTGLEPEVLAASGKAMLIARGEEGERTYRVTTDAGLNWQVFEEPALDPARVRHTANGAVVYAGAADTDDAGDFTPVYRYTFATGDSEHLVRVDTDTIAALGPAAAVYERDGGYAAQGFAGEPATQLDPATATGALAGVGTDAALFATVKRDSAQRVGLGRLNLVPLAGAPGSQSKVTGLLAAGIREGRVAWVTGTSKAATICFRATGKWSATPACTKLKSGKYTAATAKVELGDNWALVTLAKSAGSAASRFVVTGTSKPGKPSQVSRTSAMQSLAMFGRGDSDWPIGSMVTAAGGFIVRYDLAKKKLVQLFEYPRVLTSRVAQLQLTPAAVLGLDNRPATEVDGRQAWRRDVGDELGADTLFAPRARRLFASAGRTLLADTGNALRLLEGMKPVRTLPASAGLGALSGPYYLTRDGGRSQVHHIDRTWRFGGDGIVALFGSIVVQQDGTDITLTELVSKTETHVTLPPGVQVRGMWGDWLLGADAGGNTVVVSIKNGELKTRTGRPEAIGDGFAVLALPDPDDGWARLAVWNFVDDKVTTLADRWYHEGEFADTVATDGVHRLAYTTASDLVVVDLDDLETAGNVSRARALRYVAPALFYNKPASAKWSFELDATKPLAASGGSIEITTAADPSFLVRIHVNDVDGDGSVRGTWDGRTGEGAVAPPGSYRWTFRALGRDDGVVIRAVDGTSEVAGQIKLVNKTPAALRTATPKLDRSKPVVGQLVTASPGAWAAQAQPVRFGYQWYRGSKAIVGATGQQYRVATADRGAKLRVKVTGMADGQAAKSKYSGYTSRVK